MFKKKRLRSMISLLLSFTMSVGLLYIPVSALDDPADTLAAKEAAVISAAETNGGLIAVGTRLTEEEAALIEKSLEQDRQAAERDYRFTPFSAAYSAGNGSTNYFYNQLTSAEKTFYDNIKSAAESFYSSNIDVTENYYASVSYNASALNAAALKKVYNLFYHSNPKYFFTYAAYSYSTSGSNGTFYPMIMDKFKSASVRNSYKSQLASVTSSWLSQINALSGDSVREEKIYTLLCDKIVYTHDSPFDQSLAAALIDGKCVCNGYAQSMVYLCNLANIDCIMLVSDAHAWNMVKLDNVWYYIDVTWMDQDWGIWEDWINVDSAAKVTAQDQDNNHVLLTSLYSGISLPQAGGSSSGSGGNSGGNSGGSSGGNSGGSSSNGVVNENALKLYNLYTITAESVYATPVVKVTMPKSMSFVFNPFNIKVTEKSSIDPYGNNQKIICNYNDPENDSWLITNHSGKPIKAGIYAWSEKDVTVDFSVRDATRNTVDHSDTTKKYLLLDIQANGQKITLLDPRLRTDEGDNSAKLNIRAGWWSSENEGLITVIRGIADGENISISMSGDTVNAGDLLWRNSDKVSIGFVFNFEVEDPV